MEVIVVQLLLMPMIWSLLFIYDYNNNSGDNVDNDNDDDITLSNK